MYFLGLLFKRINIYISHDTYLLIHACDFSSSQYSTHRHTKNLILIIYRIMYTACHFNMYSIILANVLLNQLTKSKLVDFVNSFLSQLLNILDRPFPLSMHVRSLLVCVLKIFVFITIINC